MSIKKGLTLGGGGSKGGYQIGAWKALREIGYEFDIVTGTSIGALNGALIVQGDFERTLELWNKAETQNVLGYEPADNFESIEGLIGTYKNLTLELLKNKGLGFEPVLEIIGEYFDKDKFRQSPIDYALMTVKIPTLEGVPFYKKDIPYGMEGEYFCASAACFPAMKMKEIDGTLYIDGGYRDNVPVALAVKAGATEVVAVDLAAPGVVRSFDFPGIDVKHIRCRWDLGNFIIVDQDVSKRNINLGYLDTLKAFDIYEGEFYAFEKDGLSEKVELLREKSKLFLAEANIAYTGETDDTAFRLSYGSVKKRLEFEWSKDLEEERFVLALAETLGKIFQISPERAYNIDQFNRLLIEKFHAVEIPYEMDVKSKEALSDLIKKGVGIIKAEGIKKPLETKFNEFREKLENLDIVNRIGSLSVNMANWQVINIKQRINIHEMVNIIQSVPKEKLLEEFTVVGILNAYDFFLGAYMQMILDYYEKIEVNK